MSNYIVNDHLISDDLKLLAIKKLPLWCRVVRRCGEIVKQRGSTTAPRPTITHTPAATTTPKTASRPSP